MIADILKDSILANIGPLKKAPKNWMKRNCPLCMSQGYGIDKRNRFGIQLGYDSIALNCFNCGFSAGYTEGTELSSKFKFFLKHINIDDNFIRYVDFEVFKRKNSITSIRDGEADTTYEDRELKFRQLFNRWKTIELPKDSLSISVWLAAGLDAPEFLEVVEYMLNRRIYDLENFYWTPITSYGLNRRLTIPYYYNKSSYFFCNLSSLSFESFSFIYFSLHNWSYFFYNSSLDNNKLS